MTRIKESFRNVKQASELPEDSFFVCVGGRRGTISPRLEGLCKRERRHGVLARLEVLGLLSDGTELMYLVHSAKHARIPAYLAEDTPSFGAFRLTVYIFADPIQARRRRIRTKTCGDLIRRCNIKAEEHT